MGLTLFVLSLSNTGLVPSAAAVVLSVALAYGGGAQLIAGIVAFLVGDTFAATAFTTLSAFWLSFWWLETNPAVARQAGFTGIGVYLLMWAIFSVTMVLAAAKKDRVTLLMFIALTVTFVCLALGTLNGALWVSQTGGWFGLLTAALACYKAAAAVVNDAWGRAVLPLGSPLRWIDRPVTAAPAVSSTSTGL